MAKASRAQAGSKRETSRCRLCETVKPREQFYVRRSGRLRTECKQCFRDQVRLRALNVSPSQYSRMLRDQRGRCAICGTTFNTSYHKRLCVDHCHKTGRIRGLLCNNCNTAIGLMKDSPIRLMAAAAYLQREEDIVCSAGQSAAGSSEPGLE